MHRKMQFPSEHTAPSTQSTPDRQQRPSHAPRTPTTSAVKADATSSADDARTAAT
jgi:hypothetical protein